MKKNRMKKVFCTLLALFLMAGLLPTTALAESNVDNVVQIESTGIGYPSIRAAVDAATDGDTVVVIRDHVIDCSNPTGSKNSIIEVNEKSVTIDLNGKNMTGTVDYSKEITIFSVVSGGNLTLKDEAGGGSVSITAVSNVHSMMRALDGSSSLTVEGGSYQIDKVTSALFYTASSGNVVVNGGTFRLGNVGTSTNGSPWIFNASGQNNGHIKVNGGTFNADVFNQYWIFEAQGPETKALVKNGSDTWTLVDAVAYTAGREYSGGWWNYPLGYTSLEAAVAAADQVNRGGTATDKPEDVVLLTTCSINDTLSIPQSFTLNMNGNTIKWEGGDDKPILSVAAGKTLTIEDFTPLREGHSFVGWHTDAALTTSSSYNLASKGKVDGGTDLYAKWELKSYSVTATAGEGGTVSGGGTYNYGDTVNLNAYVNEGYDFVGWKKDGETISTNASYSFIATEDCELVAEFKLREYFIAVTVNPADSGTAEGGGTYKHGETVTLTATPAEGYRFVKWDEERGTDSNESIYSFTATADRHLFAVFEEVSVPSGTIITTTLPNGTVGTAYNQTLEAEAPSSTTVLWHIASGDLPDGLSLSTNGVISGTPTKTGTFRFTVVIFDPAESFSDTQELSITVQSASVVPDPDPENPPTIVNTTKAQDVLVYVGDKATMSVTATGADSYQWYVDRGDGYEAIPGAVNASYTTSAVELKNDGYKYYCVAKNAYGTDTSPVFTLNVLEYIDIPKTGDNSQTGLWVGLAMLSLAGIVATTLVSRKRQYKN